MLSAHVLAKVKTLAQSAAADLEMSIAGFVPADDYMTPAYRRELVKFAVETFRAQLEPRFERRASW